MRIKSNLTQEQINFYNAGLKMSQWQLTKAMLALSTSDVLTDEIKRLLKFIHNEIEKEKK